MLASELPSSRVRALRFSSATFAVPDIQDHVSDEECHDYQPDESESILTEPGSTDAVRGQRNEDKAAAYVVVSNDWHPGDYATASLESAGPR